MSCRLIFKAGVKGGSGKMRAAHFVITLLRSRWTSLIHPTTKTTAAQKERCSDTPQSGKAERSSTCLTEPIQNGRHSHPQCFVFFY
jgi:hypothetical protein